MTADICSRLTLGSVLVLPWRASAWQCLYLHINWGAVVSCTIRAADNKTFSTCTTLLEAAGWFHYCTCHGIFSALRWSVYMAGCVYLCFGSFWTSKGRRMVPNLTRSDAGRLWKVVTQFGTGCAPLLYNGTVASLPVTTRICVSFISTWPSRNHPCLHSMKSPSSESVGKWQWDLLTISLAISMMADINVTLSWCKHHVASILGCSSLLIRGCLCWMCLHVKMQQP